jgi:dihydrolipoamide dehydrogenase
MASRYDVAIIGAGPGGYVAAVRAAQLGFKTVCIDKRETLGGTCLNVGCIPSKALLHSTGVYAYLKGAGSALGLDASQLEFKFAEIMKSKQEIVKGLTEGVAGLFKKHGVTALYGAAHFIDPHHLSVVNDSGVSEVEADWVIIATGSESITLPMLPFDEKQILSSTGALQLKQVPDRLLVIGGGVIGVELASVYSRLGSKVTVVEMLDRICPALDTALSKYLLQSLQKQGITFLLSTQVVTAVVQPQEVILTVNHKGDQMQNLNGDAVLVAVGRRPFTQGLKLENARVKTDAKGFIVVDHAFRTTQKKIFAIGDVIEGTMLAHRASAEAESVVNALKGQYQVVNELSIPNVVYTHPEVAVVGLSEEECRHAGLDVAVGVSWFKGNARARCMRDTEGFVKIIGDKVSGRLVGMHIIGPQASELIVEGMAAMEMKVLVKEIEHWPHAHPTLSETVKEAAFEAIHNMNATG